jgi:hypothetical protein
LENGVKCIVRNLKYFPFLSLCNEMGSACGMHEKGLKKVCFFCGRNLKNRQGFEGLDAVGRVILKWIKMKYECVG